MYKLRFFLSATVATDLFLLGNECVSVKIRATCEPLLPPSMGFGVKLLNEETAGVDAGRIPQKPCVTPVKAKDLVTDKLFLHLAKKMLCSPDKSRRLTIAMLKEMKRRCYYYNYCNFIIKCKCSVHC